MKIKTSELTDAALRWAVATLEGYTNLRRGVFSGELVMEPPRKEYGAVEFSSICYDTDWSQGGPIIEREKIEMKYLGYDRPPYWGALKFSPAKYERQAGIGHTPLVAAMRCYVASKLGDEVEVPDELLA